MLGVSWATSKPSINSIQFKSVHISVCSSTNSNTINFGFSDFYNPTWSTTSLLTPITKNVAASTTQTSHLSPPPTSTPTVLCHWWCTRTIRRSLTSSNKKTPLWSVLQSTKTCQTLSFHVLWRQFMIVHAMPYWWWLWHAITLGWDWTLGAYSSFSFCLICRWGSVNCLISSGGLELIIRHMCNKLVRCIWERGITRCLVVIWGLATIQLDIFGTIFLFTGYIWRHITQKIL